MEGQAAIDLEKADGLPVSDRLLIELSARFPEKNQIDAVSEFRMLAGEALRYLHDFYDGYELSQPQRRIRNRAEQLLSGISRDGFVRFVTADVSEHRSRRHLNQDRKKTEQLY